MAKLIIELRVFGSNLKATIVGRDLVAKGERLIDDENERMLSLQPHPASAQMLGKKRIQGSYADQEP